MLRYKGKPHRGSNIVADKMDDLCFCRFVGVGVPLDDKDCSVHNGPYGCDRCRCSDYRPSEIKLNPIHWPVCCCGHIAQEHNQSRG